MRFQSFVRLAKLSTVFSCLLAAIVLFVSVPMAYAQQANPLDRSRWQLVSIDGEEVAAGKTVTITFGEENSAGGLGVCNTYGSTYTLSGDNGITFTDVISTMMACLEEGVMEQEAAYFAALQAATAYEITDEQLVISYGDDQKLVYEPAPTLPGTNWRLTQIGTDSVIENSEVTLNFDAEGNATGKGGCNEYGTTYTADGSDLSFGDVISTEMACLDEAVMQQEAAFFAALAAAKSYAFEDSTLTITYGDEGAVLVFTRVVELAGTAWQLESIGDVAVTTLVTLQFGAQPEQANGEGTVEGLGGCNGYGGKVTVSGDQITFTEIVRTMMACEGGVTELENTYIAALESAQRFELTEDRLTITTANGDTLVFVPAVTVSN
jgi:heat shock protein HslJ